MVVGCDFRFATAEVIVSEGTRHNAMTVVPTKDLLSIVAIANAGLAGFLERTGEPSEPVGDSE